jgi:hypothetical protein
MLSLLSDYFQYRSLKGRYNNGAESLIPDLFDEKIPDDVLAILKPGDLIWMSSKHSIRSWLIMYYCHLPLSHVSTYLGERNITHATTDCGVIAHKIDDLFNRGFRFLPCRMFFGDKNKRELIQEAAKDWIGVPYSYRRVFLAWLYIVSGRNWGTFKWKFYSDFLIVYLFCAAIMPFPLNRLIVCVGAVHLAVIAVFGLLWNVKPIPFHGRGMSLNMYFTVRLHAGMLPLINRIGTLDKSDEVVAVFREKD